MKTNADALVEVAVGGEVWPAAGARDPYKATSEGIAAVLQSVLRENPPALVCILTLVGIVGVSLFLGIRAVESREYVLDQ